jgi:uridine kinase
MKDKTRVILDLPEESIQDIEVIRQKLRHIDKTTAIKIALYRYAQHLKKEER